MQRARFVPLALLAFAVTTTARAAVFDDMGRLSFRSDAVWTQSFESWTPPDGGSGDLKVVEGSPALHGDKQLHLRLAEDAFSLQLPIGMPSGRFRVSYWIKGDCVGGAAADYDDGTPPSLVHAFPTGRITSDGWIEMQTAALDADGTALGADIRMFLRAYDASSPVEVELDAVEIVRDGDYVAPESCTQWNDPVCGDDAMCVRGICHDARGWFPPLPDQTTRKAIAAYWKQKISDTFGPYVPRKQAMPDALQALDDLPDATSNVRFWSSFTRAIRLLSDAHTYTRSPFLTQIRAEHPFNGCFMQGDADLTHDAWPSDPSWPDVLVSHVGKDLTWNLHPGDRLVAVDGVHPLAWVRQLFPESPWVWVADDPAQHANLLALLRGAIPLHARAITVIRCDSNVGTCNSSPEQVEITSMPRVSPSDPIELVGCDSRPSFHVPGAPDDHRFASGLEDPTIVEGALFESKPEEKLRGLVWNTLLGDGESQAADVLLLKAVKSWQSARGVVQDHREGHGGTAATANILIGFSRKTYWPLVSLLRAHVQDEGPIDAEEGKQWFNDLKASHGEKAGSSTPRADIPVALLLTWDVSASDILPFEMQGVPNVRLFGPGPTMGAFGTFYQYSYWGGLLWSIGAEDSISPAGVTLSGHGVVPDEIVVPRQSDLLKGHDTVHDAALAWIRKGFAQ